MKINYTQLSLNINKKLKVDLKELIRKDTKYSSIKDLLKGEIKNFIYENEFYKKSADYNKINEELMNVEILKKYKNKLLEITKEDNEFFNMKEIILYIIKNYVDKK